MKRLNILSVLTLCLFIAGCTHQVDVTKRTIENDRSALYEASTQNAQSTCQAQYADEKQNFLSAIQTHIADAGPGAMANRVPLDRFRAEINAAYNVAVARCKTHIRCLEANGYDEARCYISAYDRKDAEREFSRLAIKLRELSNELDKAEAAANAGAGQPAALPNITIKTDVDQRNDQKSDQTNHQKQKVKVCCKDETCCKRHKHRCCKKKACCKGG